MREVCVCRVGKVERLAAYENILHSFCTSYAAGINLQSFGMNVMVIGIYLIVTQEIAATCSPLLPLEVINRVAKERYAARQNLPGHYRHL